MHWSLARILGSLFGIATQIVFLWTVVNLFLFLRYGGSTHGSAWFVFDVALAVGFAIPHSLLLVPAIQKPLKALIPSGLLGCVHCLSTCISLLIVFRYWGVSEGAIWRASGWVQSLILTGFYASWIALFYSLYLTGMGFQTGLTQWWYWLRNQPAPRREFIVRGAYRWLRHPVYMSFLGLIWFTPTMTWDHAVLTIVWTAYIYAGSYFKDQRLLRYLGPAYREYATRVPGLLWIGWGSLGKMPTETR